MERVLKPLVRKYAVQHPHLKYLLRKEAPDDDTSKQLEGEARAKDEKIKAYFSKGSEIVASFEKAEQEYSEDYPLKGKLIAQARGKPSADDSSRNEVAFEHTPTLNSIRLSRY